MVNEIEIVSRVADAHAFRKTNLIFFSKTIKGRTFDGLTEVPITRCSPAPERHLKSLANIGRCFHDKDTAEKIKTAATAAATARIIEEKLNPVDDFIQTDCRK